jgi:hypothetical protein
MYVSEYKHANKVRTVIIGLVLQIIDRHRFLIRHVRAVFERHGPSMIRSFSLLWHVFLGLIKDLKVGVLPINLDSLDRCERVNRICAKRQFSNEIRDYLYEAIQTKAERNFSWNLLLLGSVENSLLTSRKDLHKSLNTITDGLVVTYHRYLRSIPFGHRDDAVKLLQLLLASSRPLALEAMSIAFALGDSDIR